MTLVITYPVTGTVIKLENLSQQRVNAHINQLSKLKEESVADPHVLVEVRD